MLPFQKGEFDVNTHPHSTLASLYGLSQPGLLTRSPTLRG